MRGRALLSGAFLAASWLSCQHAQASVIGFYSFNGDVNDSSGNGNNGTAHGAISYTANAPFGGLALTLNGNRSNFVTVPIDSQTGTHPNETFGGWIFVPSGVPIANTGVISVDNCCYDRTLDLDTRPGGFQYSAFTGTGVAGGGQVQFDQWVFFAVSYNNTANSYILQVGTNQVSGSTAFDGNAQVPTYIGQNPNFDLGFHGELADVFFYDTALTGAELANIQLNGPSVVLNDASAPEPSSLLLLGSASALVAAARARRG